MNTQSSYASGTFSDAAPENHSHLDSFLQGRQIRTNIPGSKRASCGVLDAVVVRLHLLDVWETASV